MLQGACRKPSTQLHTSNGLGQLPTQARWSAISPPGAARAQRHRSAGEEPQGWLSRVAPASDGLRPKEKHPQFLTSVKMTPVPNSPRMHPDIGGNPQGALSHLSHLQTTPACHWFKAVLRSWGSTGLIKTKVPSLWVPLA